MLELRFIPVVLISDESFVKTRNFKQPVLIGDPVNTVKIFNEFEVDEIIVLDIEASRRNLPPNLNLLKSISEQCFMPITYGGGIKSRNQAQEILELGIEKISLNTSIFRDGRLIQEIAKEFGNQSVVASIDVLESRGKYTVVCPEEIKSHVDVIDWARHVEDLGAGEILLTSVNREGSWSGYDLEIVNLVAKAVSIPVVAHGGAGCANDMTKVLKDTDASAAACGSLVVFQKKNYGVLISFPDFSMK